MQKHKGRLYPYFETGTEGIVWALIEDGKTEFYDALVTIEEGDHLVVYGEDNSVLFDGDIMMDTETGWREYPQNPGHGQQAALGCWIHWIQRGWEPDAWAGLFLRGKKNPLRCELIKRIKH